MEQALSGRVVDFLDKPPDIPRRKFRQDVDKSLCYIIAIIIQAMQ
jgi:hypothetical protein